MELKVFPSAPCVFASTRRRGVFQHGQLLLVEGLKLVLPLREPGHFLHLHRRHLVFRAVGRPIGIIGGDDIGTGFGEVERGVHNARLHPFSH